MTEKKALSATEIAFEKGYLSDKKVILMPSPRSGKMISDPRHVAYFKIDGATTSFCLPRNSRGDLVQVFKDDEERKFFENELGLDLNVSRPGNHFEKMMVSVTKDAGLMHKGETFDASIPMDNLRLRILKAEKTIAPSWAERLNRVEYQWALIDESELKKEEEEVFDSQQDFWMEIGKINEDTPKMRTVLKVYFATINSSKKVNMDSTKALLMKEINTISSDKAARSEFLTIIRNDLFDSKVLALQSVESGGITKQGKDTFAFTGEEKTYTFNELAARIKEAKDEQEEIYYKLLAHIKENKE